MTQGHKVLRYLTIIFKKYFLDFGEPDNVTGGKQVFACHNFLDYSGEARNSSISINIEETMAILTRLEDTAGQQNGYLSMSKLLCLKLEMLLRRWVLFLVRSQFPAQLSEPMPDYVFGQCSYYYFFYHSGWTNWYFPLNYIFFIFFCVITIFFSIQMQLWREPPTAHISVGRHSRAGRVDSGETSDQNWKTPAVQRSPAMINMRINIQLVDIWRI